MSAQGLQYIYSQFGGNLDAIKAFYDFNVSGNYVDNVAQNFSGSYLGNISGSQPSFWANSGYGTFSQHVVTVSGTQNLTLSDFSVFFWGNRQNNTRDNVLFSSLENYISGISSGAHIFINPANKLVFLFNSCKGTQSYASSFNVISDFAIGVSKSNNLVHLYQYDYYGAVVNADSFVIDRSSDYFPINHFSIGYAPSGANLVNNQFFSGKLDNFILVSGSVDSSVAQLIFSGIYTTKQTITTPLVSGDECTGLAILSSTTFASTPIAIPTGAFLKQGILIYSQPIVATDLTILDCAPSGQHLFNQKTLRNSASEFSLNQSTFNNIGLYLNGQRLVSGQSTITGSFCTTGAFFPRDYDIRNNRDIIGISGLEGTDELKYDVKDASYIPQAVLSSGTGIFSVNNIYGIGLYINGIRSIDFTQSGTAITPASNLNNNDVILIDYFDNSVILNNLVASQNPYFVSGGFIAGTSMVYLNGQRLTLNRDYIEINSGEYSSFLFKNVPETTIFETTTIDSTWNV